MEKEIRIGIVGVKFAGNFHAECWSGTSGIRIHAVAGKDPAARSAFMEHHGIARGYEDHRALLKDPDVDVVDICAPNFTHAEIAIEALEAGKDVICEKPLATTLADARKVVEAQARTGRSLFYAEDWIFAPSLVRAKAIIAEGGIGKPVYLRCKECHNGSHSPYAQTIRYCGGGSIIHLAVHPIGFLHHMLGAPRAVTGRCSEGGERNLVHHGLEGEDWGIGILTYADGVQAVVEGNYVTTGGMEDFFEAYGTDGVIKVEMSHGSPLHVYSRKGYAYAMEKADFTHGWTRPSVDENASLGYRDQFAHFAKCLQGLAEQVKGTRAEDGLEVMRVIDAIYRSSREGRTVELAG
jgi:predicted dehydrogenase